MRSADGSSRTVVTIAGGIAGTAAVVALAAAHSEALGAAFDRCSPPLLAAAVALHLGALVARSEATRLTLNALSPSRLPRAILHGASAGGFLAGAVEGTGAPVVRIALLRRFAAERAPRVRQMAVADASIFALELAAACVILGAGAAWGADVPAVVPPLGLALAASVLLSLRLIHRRFPERPMAAALAVLADRRRRGALGGLVWLIAVLGVTRVWVILVAFGLPHGPPQVALVFIGLGVLGLVPIGMSAGPGATVAVLGAAHTGAAVAAGLAVAGTGLLGVLVYATLIASYLAVPRVAPQPSVEASQRAGGPFGPWRGRRGGRMLTAWGRATYGERSGTSPGGSNITWRAMTAAAALCGRYGDDDHRTDS